jgi:hypothetical protein
LKFLNRSATLKYLHLCDSNVFSGGVGQANRIARFTVSQQIVLATVWLASGIPRAPMLPGLGPFSPILTKTLQRQRPLARRGTLRRASRR